MYSSDSVTWSEATSAQLTYDRLNWEVLPALAGNALYFIFERGITMLKYNLATRDMSLIPLPATHFFRRIVPMAMDDGGLELTEVDM